jgi:hypothetical protein
MRIVREASVSFEIRAHHHRLILGGKRGRKRAKKKEKHNRHFHLRAMNERERKNARANARSLFSNALKK